VTRVELAHPDEAQIRQIRLAVLVAFRQRRKLREMKASQVTKVESFARGPRRRKA
jgi:hypothetical protein